MSFVSFAFALLYEGLVPLLSEHFPYLSLTGVQMPRIWMNIEE